MKKYIAKKDTWFDEGTEAKPITKIYSEWSEPWVLFEGIKNGKKHKIDYRKDR